MDIKLPTFTDLHRDSQFAILAFIVFLCFLAYFATMAEAAASDSIFDPVWTYTGPIAKKPYVYITVRDVELVCRQIGAKPTQEGGKINACNLITKQLDCFIYLPIRVPEDIIQHEEKHCAGWQHD